MPTKSLPAWSFSRWFVYTSCPAKAKFKFIDKLKEPEGPALAKGNAVHKDAEEYLTGVKRTLPASLKSLEKEFKELKKMKPKCEIQWAFDANWGPTGWFDADAYVRAMADAVGSPAPGVLRMIDFKTGREYPYHVDQLSLYALSVFKKFLDINQVSAELWYIDTGKVVTMEFSRAEEKDLEKHWKKETAKMMKDVTFEPKPSLDSCKFCHFKKANNGPCKY